MKSANFKNTLFIVITIVFACFISCNKAFSQQTIITVPSSEVLPSGTFMLKSSVKNQINENGYTKVTPSLTFGIGHGTDISVGVPVKINRSSDTQIEGNFGIKKVIFLGTATRLTLGGNISPSFNHSVTPTMFTYAHITQKIKKSKTGITAGVYAQGKHHFPNQGGVLVGLEQVIIPNKLRVGFDWLSGHNDMGNFAIGLKYKPERTVSITSAVIIPNKSSQSLAFQFSLSKFFSIDTDKNPKERL